MNLVLNPEKSFYEVSHDEKAELERWLDEVTVCSEPEDITGKVFIDNFIDDEKWKEKANGIVNGVLQRYPYEPKAADLTDVVIEGSEIYETNSTKGIYFSAANPEAGEGYANYHLGFKANDYRHARHNGRAYLQTCPPNEISGDYSFRFDYSIRDDFGHRMYSDYTNYTITADENTIVTEVACDGIDVVGGMLTFRPIDSTSYEHSSLAYHCKFISHLLGISPPDFV